MKLSNFRKMKSLTQRRAKRTLYNNKLYWNHYTKLLHYTLSRIYPAFARSYATKTQQRVFRHLSTIRSSTRQFGRPQWLRRTHSTISFSINPPHAPRMNKKRHCGIKLMVIFGTTDWLENSADLLAARAEIWLSPSDVIMHSEWLHG